MIEWSDVDLAVREVDTCELSVDLSAVEHELIKRPRMSSKTVAPRGYSLPC
jgi:hypothetical protein